MKREKWTMSGCGQFLFIILFLFNSTWIFAWSTKEIKGTAREITLKKSPDDSVKCHEKKRQQILKNMEKTMGKLPERSNLPPLDIRVTDSLKEDTYTRFTINFTVAENERVPVYLYIPFQKGTPKKLPAMLVLHGTHALGKGVVDGQGEKPNRAHARELAQRGYVVIAPDYPSFGDLKDHDFETDRYKSATMQAIFNHIRCIDLLQSRSDVDPDNIGVIGHSLGGHNSMFVAAFDTRIKVAVSSCGWTQFEYYNIGEEGSKKHGGRLGPWAQTRYMPLIRTKYKLDAKRIPFNFDDIISAIAPRAFFSVSPLSDSNFNVEGVRKGISIAEQTYTILGAGDMLQVRYPQAEHDFPIESRIEAYAFIDKMLNFKPLNLYIY
jgi:pimeloyl-ACP methyl ester carboxylesterase